MQLARVADGLLVGEHPDPAVAAGLHVHGLVHQPHAAIVDQVVDGVGDVGGAVQALGKLDDGGLAEQEALDEQVGEKDGLADTRVADNEKNLLDLLAQAPVGHQHHGAVLGADPLSIAWPRRLAGAYSTVQLLVRLPDQQPVLPARQQRPGRRELGIVVVLVVADDLIQRQFPEGGRRGFGILVGAKLGHLHLEIDKHLVVQAIVLLPEDLEERLQSRPL